MKNKFLALLLTVLVAAFSATAQEWQSDIENFDESLWPDETMVYVKIVSEGQSVSGYSVLAYIDGELRGYAPVPRTLGGVSPVYIYNVRVKGDAIDLGKKIDWCVVIEQSAFMMPDDHYVVRGDVTWTGEAATLPSKPLVIELNGIVNVEGLNVAYGAEEFYRHIYDYTSPLMLDDCYTVYPENATNKSVNMELEPGFEKQGTLVLRYGKWVFIPSSTCKGEIKIRITSAENQAYTGVHTMFCRVAVEEVRINKSARTNLLLGDIVSLWDYYDVYPTMPTIRRWISSIIIISALLTSSQIPTSPCIRLWPPATRR